MKTMIILIIHLYLKSRLNHIKALVLKVENPGKKNNFKKNNFFFPKRKSTCIQNNNNVRVGEIWCKKWLV